MTATQSNLAAVSLAILKINSDDGKDYIDCFVPFVLDSVKNGAPQVSLPALQEDILTRFGLALPQGALQTIVHRAAKRGYLRRWNNIYIRDESALADVDLVRRRNDAIRDFEALQQKLIAFANERFALVLSPEDAASKFMEFLNESSGLVLRGVLGKGFVPEAEAALPSDFVIGSFVIELEKRDPVGFAFLETVAKGTMLACVLSFPNLGAVGRKFDNLQVYFDTRFILQALGLEGIQQQKPRTELLELLYGQNAQLFVFEDTLAEIRGVLQAAVTVLRVGAGAQSTGETIRYLQRNGFTPSDVELVLAQLEQSLRGLRINVRERPEHTTDLSINEGLLTETLKARINHFSADALTHDVQALAAIHRLRGGAFRRTSRRPRRSLSPHTASSRGGVETSATRSIQTKASATAFLMIGWQRSFGSRHRNAHPTSRHKGLSRTVTQP